MASSADPDQIASSTDLDLHCLQKRTYSGFSRTKVKKEGVGAGGGRGVGGGWRRE